MYQPPEGRPEFEVVPAGTVFESRARAGRDFGKTLEIEVQSAPSRTGFQDYRYRLKGRKRWNESMAQSDMVAQWKAEATT